MRLSGVRRVGCNLIMGLGLDEAGIPFAFYDAVGELYNPLLLCKRRLSAEPKELISYWFPLTLAPFH